MKIYIYITIVGHDAGLKFSGNEPELEFSVASGQFLCINFISKDKELTRTDADHSV